MPDMPSLAPPLRGVRARRGATLGALRAHHLTDGDRLSLPGDVDSRTAGTGRPMPRLHFAGRLQSFSSTPLSTRATLRGAPCASLHRRRPGCPQGRRFADGGHGTTDARLHLAGRLRVSSSRRPSPVSGGPIGPALASRLDTRSTTGPGRPRPRLLRRPHRGCAGLIRPLLLCAAGRWFVRAAAPRVENLPLCVTGSGFRPPRASSRGCAMSNCCVDARPLSRGPAACRVLVGADEQSRYAQLGHRGGQRTPGFSRRRPPLLCPISTPRRESDLLVDNSACTKAWSTTNKTPGLKKEKFLHMPAFRLVQRSLGVFG